MFGATPRLALPLLAAAQAQKHVTHNEALSLADALVHLAVEGRAVAPPVDPAEGARLLIEEGATGAFAGRAGEVALRRDGAWTFLAPQEGWRLWDTSSKVLLVRSNGAWSVALPSQARFASLGVNTPADAVNRLAVSSEAALFTHAGRDHRLVVNKSAATATASLVFQSNWGGRAEFGLCGDDRLRLKASADGALWRDALSIDPTSGLASFPQTTNRPNGLAGLDADALLGRDLLPQLSGDAGAGGARGVAPAPGAGDAAARKVLGAGGGWIAQSTFLRNRLRNASFVVNQRVVSGVVTLAAGAYGHDGVRAGAGGASYTFSASGADVALAIASGSLILPIEGSWIEGGTYALSQAGTASARVWQGEGTAGAGAYAACPRTVTALAAGQQTNVEFSVGTVLRPQFELGDAPTPFERRPTAIELPLCLRYYEKSYAQPIAPATPTVPGYARALGGGNTLVAIFVPFRAIKRATPVVTMLSWSSGAAGKLYDQTAAVDKGATIYSVTDGGFSGVDAMTSVSLGAALLFHWTAAAELP